MCGESASLRPRLPRTLRLALLGFLAALLACPSPLSADSAPATARTQHWAFVPPQRIAPPTVKNTRWPRNPIDAFVLARLEKEKILPSPEANRATLIRRLSFDLIGLPPGAEEVRAFVQDRDPEAYTRLVDRLLDSPHFGENWARHWLDLARYADSDGYEKDGVRPYAYLYRDWVIAAFNRDLPFDQFTLEQLAGDLLPGSTRDQKTATGFHRQTLTNKEGGVDQEEFRTKAVVDRVNTTAAAWLGLTIGCAECHDHKYDPLSQREFFQLYAFFNNASEKDLPLEASGPDAPPPGDSVKDTKDKKDSKNKQPAAAILVEDEKPRGTRIHVRGDFLRPGEAVQPGTPGVLHPFAARGDHPDRLDLARWLVDPANPLTARVTVNRFWRHLFGRGLVPTLDDFGTRGDPASHPELLDWLANEFVHPEVTKFQNCKVPKAAASTADSVCNGGTSATKLRPWSQKALIRLIVHSATYRQASFHRDDLANRDPLNMLLARQGRFRLDAENVRDTWLAASGLLTRQLGGPSVRPPLPADIAAIGYAGSIKWQNSDGPDRYRRGLYVFFQRTVPYPMLTTFDAPDSTAACTRRERSNTPLQALTLLNDPVFFECAQALGRRMKSREGDPGSRLRFAFEHCLGRAPNREELARLQQLHAAHLRLASPDDSLTAAARVMMNLDEFVTRE
jgi:hypothetical protein